MPSIEQSMAFVRLYPGWFIGLPRDKKQQKIFLSTQIISM